MRFEDRGPVVRQRLLCMGGRWLSDGRPDQDEEATHYASHRTLLAMGFTAHRQEQCQRCETENLEVRLDFQLYSRSPWQAELALAADFRHGRTTPSAGRRIGRRLVASPDPVAPRLV